jgi:hypothetical protein
MCVELCCRCYHSTFISGHRVGIEKCKRQDTQLKITLPACPSSKHAPAVDNAFVDLTDEIAADPLATEGDWTPPPISSLTECHVRVYCKGIAADTHLSFSHR